MPVFNRFLSPTLHTCRIFVHTTVWGARTVFNHYRVGEEKNIEYKMFIGFLVTSYHCSLHSMPTTPKTKQGD